MKTRNNYQNLKTELERSDNVKKVVKIRELDINDWKNKVRFTVKTSFKGYGFDLLKDKYPTLEIGDIIVNKEKEEIEITLTVEEIDLE